LNGANFVTLVTVQNADLTNGDTANFAF
jgi:hypothetical protein